MPKYIKASMSIESAARQAHMHGAHLEAYWNPTTGLRVVEVKRELETKRPR